MVGTQRLMLVKASIEQYKITIERQLLQWGKLNDQLELSLEQYASREDLLTSSTFGQRFKAWVLVPENDRTTLDFFASCETYRRSSWISTPSSGEIWRATSYSIAGVIVPFHLRGNKYAKKMLEKLQEEFSTTQVQTGSAAEEVNKTRTKFIDHQDHSDYYFKSSKIKEAKTRSHSLNWQGGNDAVFSFLFSDVGGDFYSTYGNGWHIRPSFSTTWRISIPPPTTSTSPPIPPFDSPRRLEVDQIPITLDNLNKVTSEDSEEMKLTLLAIRQNNPLAPITVAIEPTFENYEWAILRSNFYASLLNRLIPKHLGVYINKDNFIIYVPDYPNEVLKIVRLRCTPSPTTSFNHDDDFEEEISINYAFILFRSVFKAAKEFGLETIEGWNVDESILKKLDLSERGSTSERKDSLSCLSWYGDGAENDRKDSRNVDWICNEAYSWC